METTYLTTWLLMMGLTGEAWLGSVAMSAMMIEGKGPWEPHYQTLQRKKHSMKKKNPHIPVKSKAADKHCKMYITLLQYKSCRCESNSWDATNLYKPTFWKNYEQKSFWTSNFSIQIVKLLWTLEFNHMNTLGKVPLL